MKPFQNIKVTLTVEITETEDRPPVTYQTTETITGPAFDPTFTALSLHNLLNPAERAYAFVCSSLSDEEKKARGTN